MTSSSDILVEKALAGRPLDDCLVIDAHAHLGQYAAFAIADSSYQGVLRMMDRIGIDMICVSSMPAIFGDMTRGNGIVERALKAAPDRFFGYMGIEAGRREDILPEMARCLDAGFRGVKIHSTGSGSYLGYDHPNYEAVWEFTDAHRLPLLAHTWGRELHEMERAVRRYTNINWLLAHTGSAELNEYIRFGKEYPHAYLELCYSACPRGLVEKLVAKGLADKVIWGSDATFLGASQQIGRVIFAQIGLEDKYKILGLNARRILRLDEARLSAKKRARPEKTASTN